jgi:metal-responsive CopG/Arc/MetJ family transcriptional regulator
MAYKSGMKLKTSVTLSEELLKMVDRAARKGEARSQVLERLVREALAARERKETNERDRDLINRHADALNAEMEDALRYQIDL